MATSKEPAGGPVWVPPSGLERARHPHVVTPPSTPARSPWSTVATVLLAIAATAVLVVAVPQVSKWFSRHQGKAVASGTTTVPDTVPSTTVPPTTVPPTTAPGVLPSSVPMVEAPPTVQFSCPSPIQHWTASLIPTVMAADPVGYHVWYQAQGDTAWVYWGQFKSAGAVPQPLAGVPPGLVLTVRYDRSYLPDGSLAAHVVQFLAGAGC
jgi:hypothetical protein